MKTSKRLFSILLALVMVLAMAVPALAAGEKTGTISVTNAVPEQTYSVYRIFDLESYDQDGDAYIYTVNSSWSSFINQGESVSPDASKGIANISGTGGYVSVDKNGHVTWAKKNTQNKNEGMAEFAKLALAYAKTNSINPVKTSADAAGVTVTPNTGDKVGTNTIVFSNLALGYYLLDSNVGTLCSLNTTDPSVEVQDKNKQPIVDKKVQEGENWGDSNGAQIGDTVNFKVTITAQEGAQKYILHEKMDDGLTFDKTNASTSVAVKKNDTAATLNTDYTINTSPNDDCTFHVEFTDTFCDKLAADDTITVTYSAVLNENADVVDGEDNTVYLSYGEKSGIETQPKDTTTYTYQFQIIKTNDKAENDKYELLEGALFSLFTSETSSDPIEFVKESDGVYRVAVDTDSANDIVTKIPAGAPILQGLDNKKYYLEEIEAPKGYNPYEGRIEVDLSEGNSLAGDDAINLENGTFDGTEGGAWVQNSKGDKLPTTGGIGTTIFYAAGGVLVVGAGFALALMNRKSKKYAKK